MKLILIIIIIYPFWWVSYNKPVRVNQKVSTTGDVTRKRGDVEISNFPIFLRNGIIIDVSFVCEFKGNSRVPGGWDNGVRHSNDVLQARANVNKYKDAYGIVHKAFWCKHEILLQMTPI